MRTRLLVVALLCASLPFPAQAFAAASPTPAFQEADIVPGEVIVIMKADNTLGALSLPNQARVSANKRPGLAKLNAGVVNVPAGQESAYIAQLVKQKGVLAVEPNYRVEAALVPNDTFYTSHQYGPQLIQAPLAWDTTSGSGSVILAIIDSGLDATHPEFAGRITAGYDFVDDEPLPDGDPDPDDELGHGTHVAGIAAATGNNNRGIAGIASEVKIMPLRVLNGSGGGYYTDVAEALVWAADHNAKVINLSLGGASPSTLLESAVYYAYSHGSAIFAAAGNSGLGTVFYPAAYPQVMAIGSVDSTPLRSSSSSYGTALDLMAPGVNIYSTLPMKSGFYYNAILGKSTEYDYLGGTSMATPHAAGAAALLASMPGGCFGTPSQIYQAMMDSALDLGAAGWDQYYGHGLIQIADAMLECPAADPPLAPFTIEYDLVDSNTCAPLAKYNWRSASSGTWQVSVGDSGSVLVALPFTFDFGGQPYTSIRAHANGYISLGDNNTDLTDSNFRSNFLLPTAAKPDNFIAPFWDDLTDPGSARLYTDTLGTAPNRQFVIEYQGFQRVGASGSLIFEVILYEGSNNIKMQYRSLTGTGSDGDSATVGIEYGNTTTGLAGYQYSYNQPDALENGLALLFIPYTSGDPILPSHAVCPQMEAITIESGIANTCNTSPAAFSVDIATGALPYRSILRTQQTVSAPAMPASYLDMHHYADIRLAYSPPAPSLYPMPEVDVCYEYTPQDLLAAGGHPENLFIAAHDESTNHWQRLSTTVDALNMRLIARAPHFSYYGVATLNPVAGGKAEGLGFPVTGSPLSRELILFIAGAGAFFLLSGTWLRRKRR